MSLVVASPVAGATVPMSEVPDPVFAEAMVGPGVAIQPGGGRQDAVAPVDGTVVTLHPHAFVIAAADGKGVLVHLGIDTVKLKGEGFTLHVAKGDPVVAGQPVVGWDPVAVSAAGYDPVCPVIALDASADRLTELHDVGPVGAGAMLFALSSG